MADIKPRLKGHGSFVIREGWLSKALDLVRKDNTIFREKRAADLLGVGNNMGQSIRYWLKACGLMNETSSKGAVLTSLGKLIYENDPYFEDIFSIWILHCNLVMNKEAATSWYLFFNKCEVDEHTKEEVFIQMKRELELTYNHTNYSESSLKDDITALCNMYSKVKEDNYDPEDNKISPFSELGLVKNRSNKYTKAQPNLSKLNERVVLYCLIKQMNNGNSIEIDKLVDGDNSVCKILNLNRVVVNQYLDKLEELGYIRVNRTAGLDIVYKKKNVTSSDILKDYYQNLQD